MVGLWGLGSRNREGSENQDVGDKLHQVLGGEKRQLIPRVPVPGVYQLPQALAHAMISQLHLYHLCWFPVSTSDHWVPKCQLPKLVTNGGLDIHFLYCLSR